MKRITVLIAVVLTLGFVWAPFVGAGSLGCYQQGDVNLNGPAYAWWYGCSPTSAGMMMGYYDRTGYGGLYYSNLVPGMAVASTFPVTNAWDANVKDIIASKGYVNDYYRFATGVADTNSSGNAAVNIWNDDAANPIRAANCLADYMGSGQDWAAPPGQTNPNGTTWFYYWIDGSKFTAADAVANSLMVTRNGFGEAKDGMLGMDEYFRSCGYGTGSIANDKNFYTQLIHSSNAPLGFTFAKYKAEINAGRVVMIQVTGHSMFGYGYVDDATGQWILFHNTWDDLGYEMAWGGTYDGMAQWGVVCFDPTGGSAVPLPGAAWLLGSGLVGLAGLRRKFKS